MQRQHRDVTARINYSEQPACIQLCARAHQAILSISAVHAVRAIQTHFVLILRREYLWPPYGIGQAIYTFAM